MAFSAATEWEVRTTGATDNGGGFQVGSTGTDYSQQDSPQVTYTDLVIDGATNTKLTSAANPFTSAHVGNIINITSGTGFTVQRVQIVSVAAGAATCDKSCGTLGSTGGNGKLGGGLTTIAAAFALCVAQNTVWVKAGTYTLIAVAAVTVSVSLRGYSATHGDNSTKPLITTATDSTPLLDLSADPMWVDNLRLTNTASIRDQGIKRGTGTGASITATRCIFDGLSIAIGDAGAGQAPFYNGTISQCQFLNSTVRSLEIFSLLFLEDCYFSDSAGHHVDMPAAATYINRCIFARAATYGIGTTATGDRRIHVKNSVFYANGTNGIQTTGGSNMCVIGAIVNCIFWSNNTYGISLNGSLQVSSKLLLMNNAYGDNTTANINPVPAHQIGAITLTADPFTSSTDFSLNSVAGGGALCKGVGIEVSTT